MRRCLTLWLLLFALPASAQVPVIAAWDGDSTHTALATWELERNGVSQPCARVTDTSCSASVPAGVASFRVRGSVATGAGPWSIATTATVPSPTGAAPGPFTLLWHAFPPPPPPGGTMAVELDASTELNSGNVASVSFAHTVANQPNRVLYVAITANSGDFDLTTITSATYDGVAMTQFFSQTPNRQARVYRLLAPAVGANNVAVAWSGGNRTVSFIAVSLYNVDQTTPNDAYTETDDGGTSASSAATSEVGDLVLDLLVNGAGVTSLTPGKTLLKSTMNASSGISLGMSYDAGAASVTMSWTWTGITSYGHWKWNVNAVAAPADAVVAWFTG